MRMRGRPRNCGRRVLASRPGPVVPVSATIALDGFSFSITFSAVVTATFPTGWTVTGAAVSLDQAQTAGAVLTWPLIVGVFSPGDVIKVSYDGLGDLRTDPTFLPVGSFTNFPVTNPL